MDLIIELLKEINIAQIVIIFGAMWFFYKRLEVKIEKLENKIEKLNEKVEDIDRRLCRIEGSLSTHGHCLFNQEKPERKAE